MKGHMKNMKFKKIEKYFLCFLIYSFIGWLYEVLLGIFVFHLGFVNRGFLFGPYCPVYGFGALLFIYLLDRYKYNVYKVFKLNIYPLFMFIFITAITTVMELLTSYIMEFFIGEWLWDYNNYFLNFQGRVALETSIRFGIGGMVILYILHPFLMKIYSRYNEKKWFNYITYLLLFLFSIDVLFRLYFGSNFKA